MHLAAGRGFRARTPSKNDTMLKRTFDILVGLIAVVLLAAPMLDLERTVVGMFSGDVPRSLCPIRCKGR